MRTDLIWRAALPLAALVAQALHAPQAATGVVALLGLALAAERLSLLRGIGATDRVLVGVGGTLVVLVLAGMLLGSTPLGLTPSRWVTTLAVLATTGLAIAAVLPARAPTDPLAPEEAGQRTRHANRRKALVLVPWLGAAAAVVVISVQLTGTSLSRADSQPVQMSVGRVTGTEVAVIVSSLEAVGPLEVRTSADGNEISYPLFSVDADSSVTTAVSLPRQGRYVITVTYPDQTEPLRTLILDR